MHKKEGNRRWTVRQLNLDKDADLMMDLYKSTWANRPITHPSHFRWNLVDNCFGRAVAFCAQATDREDTMAGVYLVLPNRLHLSETELAFGVSLYTMTHPLYYKQGIFKVLASLTFEECKQKGLSGIVGVPNNNSLPAFTKSLNFDAIGQFDILVRCLQPGRKPGSEYRVKRIAKTGDLIGLDLSFITRRALSGTIMLERSPEFIEWRFLKCPSSSYTVNVVVDESNTACGIISYRRALRRRIPITVIMDFIVDPEHKQVESIACALLQTSYRFAFSSLTPLVITLLNPDSFEAKILMNNGFRRLPKMLLPHESNFIIRVLGALDAARIDQLKDFSKWYFSFSDYDIF